MLKFEAFRDALLNFSDHDAITSTCEPDEISEMIE